MLFLKHGGHVLEQAGPKAVALDEKREDTRLARRVSPQLDRLLAENQTTPFAYLFPELENDAQAHLPAENPATTIAALKALGAAMVEQPPPPQPAPDPGTSPIPAVYTYWGQFVDHDLTANTDRDGDVSDITADDLKPLAPGDVTQRLHNLRRPNLDLDSVYGDGPAAFGNQSVDAKFYDGIRFRLGKLSDGPGAKIPPEDDQERDLPRIGVLIEAGILKETDFSEEQRQEPNFKTFAFVGDTRNDENLIVAQLHLAFLRFHNRVVDRLEKTGGRYGFGYRRDAELFLQARRLTRWTYQWISVNDWLRTLTFPGMVDRVLHREPRHYKPKGRLFMPLEYSVAAFRFGHSMVRGAYDHNRNFGIENRPARFDDMFLFTGDGHLRLDDPPGGVTPNAMRGLPTLPSNWPIEWDRFTDKGSQLPIRFARKIDTRLAGVLFDMVNQGNLEPNPGFKALLKNLAQRNLLRGFHLSIPTGQAVAKAAGLTPLTTEELQQGNDQPLDDALAQGGLLERTPLWYYVLKEAEIRGNGNFLGELGSLIVCETIIGLLRNDPNSYLNQRGWDPGDGVRQDNGDPIVTIRDFFRFAGVGS